MAIPALLTSVIFTLTYIGVALGKIPGLRIDRAGIALVGATLMLVTGMLSLEQAFSMESIDYKTLVLLFGMMVVIAYMRLSRLFEKIARSALRRIQTPIALLAVTILLSGVLSAFLINDIVCLTLTPLVLHLARKLHFDPIPHLIALASAANIGSAATITGNPQNIYIGSHSGISYLRFALRLMPVAFLGLGINFAVMVFVYRRSLFQRNKEVLGQEPSAKSKDRDRTDSPTHRGLQRKSAAIALIAVGLFFTGFPLELIALGAASMLLLSKMNPRKVYAQVDWSLLVLFAGLFIVVHAFQVQVVTGWGIENWKWLLDRPVDMLSLVSATLSNLVSNVPAVLLMEPILKAVPEVNRETAWLALAMSSTFAGNLTILGSVANLIVVENAKREGVVISFWEYCKVGIPLTILTLALGVAWLQWVSY